MKISCAPHPTRVEIITTLNEVPAAIWDALAHGPRAGENRTGGKALAAAAESVFEPARRAHVESEHEAGLAGVVRFKGSPQSESNSQARDTEHQATESEAQEDEVNPFISHAFLSSLEDSGSVGQGTGWTPLYVLAKTESGEILGALPAYAKSHSQGEYVFDHAFAEAYHRHGQRYYPKLQVSVPFTPARARKFLISPCADETATRAALLEGLFSLSTRLNASSLHATFLTRPDQASLGEAGFLAREDRQFHFINRGYEDFESFLAALASRKRKAIKRERREALAPGMEVAGMEVAGIEVEWLTGTQITSAHWDAFFAFYHETGARKWGTPYLTRAFFALISERMGDKVLLIMAKRAGRYIAGALNFIGGNTLYGRNWGAIEHHPFLHFELCYYQAIEFALHKKLARVEAGAQGEHKLARGYEPMATHSAHFFHDERFAEAIADYLKREREAVQEMSEEMAAFTPFRRVELP